MTEKIQKLYGGEAKEHAAIEVVVWDEYGGGLHSKRIQLEKAHRFTVSLVEVTPKGGRDE
jgi:hypothetical protein